MRAARRKPWLGMLLVASAACEQCGACGEEALGELVQLDGRARRDRKAAIEKWEPASPGDEFSDGEALWTNQKAEALVALRGGGRLEMGPDTRVRFAAEAPGAKQKTLNVETGEAQIEAGESSLRLLTEIGAAVIEAGGRLEVHQTDKGLRYAVRVGGAMIETEDGPVELSEGQGIAVDIGGAVLEEFELDAEQQGEPDAGVADAGAADADAATDAGPVGVVAEVRGRGARVREEEGQSWERLNPGETTLTVGSTVRLRRGNAVQITRGPQVARLRGAGVFTIGAPDGPLVQAQWGRIQADATEEDVIIEVPGGVIVARGKVGQGAGSGVDLSVDRRGNTDVNVQRGRSKVQGKQATETLRVGEQLTLTRAGTVDVAGRGPERADFSVTAGESFTVRAPRPPAAVGFRFPSLCPKGAVAELLRGRNRYGFSRGPTQANLSIPRGRFQYEIHCVTEEGQQEKAAARGSILVLRDSGRTRLPNSAPDTLVEMDGRKYTVLYQNLLPSISVTWRKPPVGGPYELIVNSSRQGLNTVETDQARYEFPPQALKEGRHRFAFRSQRDPSKRSKETTLDIRFDNAAPTASVRSPDNRSFAPGETVEVSGVALEGWSVSVGGSPLPLDVQHRFSGSVTAPTAEDAIAIRLANPGRGVNYYLRRSQKSK